MYTIIMNNLYFFVIEKNNLNQHFHLKNFQLRVLILPIWPLKFHHGSHFVVFRCNFVRIYFNFFHHNFAQEHPISVFEVPKCRF